MRIAFVSFEYAGGVNGGGIGTYLRNAATMLAARGHSVEVFTSGKKIASEEVAAGVKIHTTPSERKGFSSAVCSVFARRHASRRFDVVEGPEYGADAAAVAEAFPELPLLVRLHTPTCLIDEINNGYIPWTTKARYLAGGLRRVRIPNRFWIYDPKSDVERAHALSADVIAAPTRAILRRLEYLWQLPPDRLMLAPHVFLPKAELLRLDPDFRTNLVTFFGRLEARKGVIELAQVIPKVVAEVPAAVFRFVGRSLPHPGTGEDLKSYLGRSLGTCGGNVEFVEGVPYGEVPKLLAETDICLFPSVWENFPNTCLEAMAAARGVIGSSAGGMAEIIQEGHTGLLVPPRAPKVLAAAIVGLLNDPRRRIAMGHAARRHVLNAYSADRIAPLQEASYVRAIQRAKARTAARN